MKKVLLTLLSVLFLLSVVGCNKTQDSVEDVHDEAVNDEEITFTSGLNITNNDVYDEGKKEYNFNNLVGEYGGFEIYNEGNQTFYLNFDGAVNAKGLIKNVSNRPLGFTLQDPTISGEFGKHEQYLEGVMHPNGSTNYVLQPGEEKIFQLDFSLFRWTSEDATESFIYNFKLGVTDEGQAERYKEFDVSFEETVIYLSNDTLLSDEYMNAIVEGRIVDRNDNPIANADVEVSSPFIELFNKIQTNENGEYSITVIGAKNSFSNAWRENALIVEKEGYNKRYIPVYPKSNQTLTADVTLYEKKQEYIYEDVKSIDIGLHAYEYDTNQSDIISFVPFHTGYNPKDVADKIRLTTTDFDGNVYYDYTLPNEIPYVDVSEDGQYTVVANNYDNGGFEIVILDRSGKEVYKTHDLKPADKKYAPDQISDTTVSRCFQLSNDSKYLVASDVDGDIWFIDWKNDKVLWSDYQFAQVRNVKFDRDENVFYLSTGAGDLFCYDFDGNIKWKSNSQSWATKMYITGTFVVLTTKCGGTNLFVFDKYDGRLVWDYPTAQGNMSLAISPDEKYLWYGAHSSSAYSKIGSSIFDLNTGELLGMLNDQNCVGAQFSIDGSKIAVKRGGDVAVYDAKNGALLWNTRICDGDSIQNCSVAINEDGSKFAVSMNEKYEGNYGIIHYFALKEIRDYINNPPANNEEPQSEQNEIDKNFVKAVVYVEIGENVRLYVDDNDCVYDFEGPNGSSNFITDGLESKNTKGKNIKDAIVDILYIADNLKIYNDDTIIKVQLEEIKSDAKSSNKEILKGVEDEVVNFRNMINVNFSYEIDDDNYQVMQ